MYVKIRGDDIFGLAYPKENLIKLLNEQFKEIEKNDEVVMFIYLNYMMFDFFKENLGKCFLECDKDECWIWTAKLIPVPRCYDVYLSNEELEESLWSKKL